MGVTVYRNINAKKVKSVATPIGKRGRVAVILAAYQATDWLKECIDSIKRQTLPRGWELDLRIGVDGCSETASALDRMGQPYFMASENVGTYVMRNSLIAVAPADAYAIFDADDVMLDGYLAKLLPLAGKDGIAGAGRETINGSGKRVISHGMRFSSGVCVISAAAMKTLGGYRPERIASDVDMIERAKLLKIRVDRCDDQLYLRRKHPASLTQAAPTRIGGRARTNVVSAHKRMRDAGAGHVEPTVVNLERLPTGSSDVATTIPRILHRIWFGPAMPEEYVRYGEAWKKLMPEWEHKLWTEENLPQLRNQDLFDRAAEIAPRNAGQLRADIVRYEVLSLHGGVYVDCDFECRKPLDGLLGAGPFAAWEAEGKWVNNAVLGGPPEHPFFLDLISGLGENVKRKAGLRPNVMSGPQYLTPIALAHAIKVYPKAWFYPYLWNELHRRNEQFPDAYAVHHWHNARRKK